MNKVLFLLAIIAYVTGQQDDDIGAVRKVADANSKFTSSLFEVLKEGHSENLIFSPFSLSTVLAMVKAGARGKTSEELQRVLNFPDDETLFKGYKSLLSSLKSNSNFTLETANRIYSKDGYKLQTDFTDKMRKYFDTEVEQLDFTKSAESAHKINSWVEDLTRDKIKNLISSDDLNSMTRLVLVNAIYFKGFWKNKFDKQLTRKGTFFVNHSKNVSVDMMKMEGDMPYTDLRDLDARAIAIPYQGDRLSLVVILPNQKDGLESLEKSLKNMDLSTITRNMHTKKVMLSMPKFKLESKIDLVEPLSQLGLKSLFDQNQADLSGIPQEREQLFVSKAVQKAFIEINEEGSEAAAATGKVIMKRSLDVEKKQKFIVNRPFIFMIQIQNNVLFNGHIYDMPEQQQIIKDEL